MTRRNKDGRDPFRPNGSGDGDVTIVRQAEVALNDAIALHGIDSGEVFAARWQVKELRRRMIGERR